MKKILSIIALFVISFNSLAQGLNDYKYALVPSKFSFSKEKDQYRLNTLSKMFMQKYGFETYLDSEILPSDFASDNCNKVYVDVIENNTIMMTKVKVVLKDCKNQVLFTSEEGKSREKDFKTAYNQALREAFNSFEALNYKYQPSQKSLGIIGEPAQTQIKEEKVAVVNEKVELGISAIAPKTNAGEISSEELRNRLSVVTTENGFDLYNIESKLIYSAKRTSLKNVYIATCGVEKGILKKDYNDNWYFEYYREGSKKLISEPLNFKF